MEIGSEYLDIDFGLRLIGMCAACEEPIFENEKPIHAERLIYCEKCFQAQEESN